MAFGAQFLKRVIDDLIKLPITMNWSTASHFRVRVTKQAIVVDTVPDQPTANNAAIPYQEVA